MDLVEFLTARLNEDEQAARAADDDLGYLIGAVEYSYPKEEVDERHALRHAPPRVLAEVDAKRRILDEHALTVEKGDADPYDSSTGERRLAEYSVTCAVCGWASDDRTSACRTLRLLALPYADHPNYDEAWRP